MGLCVAGFGLFGLGVVFCVLDLADVVECITGFGLGASSMALFGRVGGGIYTKAADVGADLVGNVEAGIPEEMRAQELNEERINKIMTVIAEKQYKLEGDLRRELMANLKRLTAIKSYRGLRHMRGLPVRGQRPSTNARTRKGKRKTVGVGQKASS